VDYQNKPSNKREVFIEAPLEFRNFRKRDVSPERKIGGELPHTSIN